jgi:hypothetical protein
MQLSPQECRDNATTFCPFVCDHYPFFGSSHAAGLGAYHFLCTLLHLLTLPNHKQSTTKLKWFDLMSLHYMNKIHF